MLTVWRLCPPCCKKQKVTFLHICIFESFPVPQLKKSFKYKTVGGFFDKVIPHVWQFWILFGFGIKRNFLTHTIKKASLEFSYLMLKGSSESNAKCMINTRNSLNEHIKKIKAMKSSHKASSAVKIIWCLNAYIYSTTV